MTEYCVKHGRYSATDGKCPSCSSDDQPQKPWTADDHKFLEGVTRKYEQRQRLDKPDASPREWWIDTDPSENGDRLHENNNGHFFDCGGIHVIEKSAYDAIAKELSWVNSQRIDVMAERDAAKAEIERLHDSRAKELGQAQQRIEEFEQQGRDTTVAYMVGYSKGKQEAEAREAKLVAIIEKIVELTGMPIAVMALKDFKGGG